MAGHLAEIRWRFYALNPRPGNAGDFQGRGAPGFGSRAPASEHVIVMRDKRSSTAAHVWVGGDGRVHRESERPPLSVFSTLLTEAVDTAERRKLTDTSELGAVVSIVRFLVRHLDWWITQPDVGEFADKLRVLVRQLRPVTGDPAPKPFARCPNTIDLGEHSRACGGWLYPPESLVSGVIRCRDCGRDWGCDEWDKLGFLLSAA